MWPEDDPYNSLLAFLSSPQSPQAVRELCLMVYARDVDEDACRTLLDCLERLDSLPVLRLSHFVSPTDNLGASKELVRALIVREDGRLLLPNLRSMEFKATKNYCYATDRMTMQYLLQTMARSRAIPKAVSG